MKKQTIIVTGASSGIGKEIARYFLEKGDNVVINSTTDDKLAKVYYELGAGSNLGMAAGDVSNKKTGEQLVATAINKFGSVDCLINNAGFSKNSDFVDMENSEHTKMININLLGVINGIETVLPRMRERKSGTIINISSVAELMLYWYQFKEMAG